MPGGGWVRQGRAAGLMVVLGLGLMGCASRRVLFEDRFDTPGTLQQNWVIQDTPVDAEEGPSDWRVEAGHLVQSSNIYRGSDEEYAYYEGTRILTRTGDSWQDYTLDVTLHPMDDDGVGILFRYMDDGRFYRFFVVQDDLNRGPRMMLQARVGDHYETLAELERGYDPDATHHVRITARGHVLQVDWNGERIFSVQDARYPRGRIGLQCYAEEGIWFDDVVVKAAE